MKIKFLKPKKKFKKNDFSVYPSIYWKIILGAASVLILLSFLFAVFVFLKVNKEVVGSPQELDLQTQTIKHERIDNLLKYFEEKEEKSNEILLSPSPIVDPSL